VFFTAPDTEQNIEWYKEKEENQLTVFTTTRKPVGVKKFQINQGTTVFLCPGVLHAVYTPSDAVVVAGNFISLAHAQRHVEIVKLEDSFKLSDNGAVIDLPVFPAIVAKGLSRAKLDPTMPKELAGFDVLVKWLLDWISSKELPDADGKIKSLCDAVDKGARRDQQRCIKSLLPIVFDCIAEQVAEH
ncbi:JmjC domain-containing histone demethylation protein 1, partial [Allomyces javanicus]